MVNVFQDKTKNLPNYIVVLPKNGNFEINKNKMGRNTSISLGNYFESFVKSRIKEGRYKNASEVVRAGLRLLEERENKVRALRNAIQEGIDSGINENFNADEFLNELKSRKQNNG